MGNRPEDEWQPCDKCKCPRCSDINAEHREDVWGNFEHRCKTCGANWVIDGPDS